LNITSDAIISSATVIHILAHNPARGSNLLLPMLGPSGELVHNGNHKKFEKQLQDFTVKAIKQLNKVAIAMEKFAATPFSATAIAAHADVKNLMSIPPGRDLQDAINKRLRTRDYSMFEKKSAVIAKNEDRITLLGELLEMNEADRLFQLDKISAANIYDFISVFVDYSQLLPTEQRADMERRVGIFANWIDQNLRKFIKIAN
jgi:hypothetical protein